MKWQRIYESANEFANGCEIKNEFVCNGNKNSRNIEMQNMDQMIMIAMPNNIDTNIKNITPNPKATTTTNIIRIEVE